MTYAFIVHAKGLQGAASAATNFTGVDFIGIGQVSYTANATSTITDSLGNTYTALTKQTGAGSTEATQILYKQNPTVGSSMTFTAGNVNADVYAAGFSGSVASPFDVQNGNAINSPGTTILPGSITPSGSGYLVLAFAGAYGPDGFTTTNGDGNYTTSDSTTMVGSVSFGACFSYFIQTTATATNPTFTNSASSNDRSAVIASFKPGSGPITVSRTSLIGSNSVRYGWG